MAALSRRLIVFHDFGPAAVDQSRPGEQSNYRGFATGTVTETGCRLALELPADRPIERVLVGAEQRVFVLDAQGSLYGVDAPTGKVLWKTDQIVPMAGTSLGIHLTNSQPNMPTDGQLAPPLANVVLDEDQRLYFARRGEVICVSGIDGQIAWRSAVAAIADSSGSSSIDRTATHVFLYHSQVIAYEPTRDKVAAFDSATGKLLWSYELGAGQPLADNRVLHSLNTGASIDGDRLFVYGRRAGMFNLAARSRLDDRAGKGAQTSGAARSSAQHDTSNAFVGICIGPQLSEHVNKSDDERPGAFQSYNRSGCAGTALRRLSATHGSAGSS